MQTIATLDAFGRDLGYAVGALLAGITADAFGLDAAMWVIAALTFVSGTVSATRMTETLQAARRAVLRGDDGSSTPVLRSRSHVAVEAHRSE